MLKEAFVAVLLRFRWDGVELMAGERRVPGAKVHSLKIAVSHQRPFSALACFVLAKKSKLSRSLKLCLMVMQFPTL